MPLTLRAPEIKSKPMEKNRTEKFVNQMWDDSIIPELSDYIRIPNKSPMFDPDWEKHGYMEQAVQQFERWSGTQPIKDMQVSTFLAIRKTWSCCTATTTNSPSSAAGRTIWVRGNP